MKQEAPLPGVEPQAVARPKTIAHRPSSGRTDPDAMAFNLVYDTIRGRRAGYDLLMWQTPALGMTAQAFLMTIALGPDTKQAARLVANLLAFVVALLSMQLMAKHRYHEGIDARLLVRLETDHGLTDVLGIAPHASPRDRERVAELPCEGESDGGKRAARASGERGWITRQWRRSSYQVWMAGLALFALTDLALVAIALVDNGALSR